MPTFVYELATAFPHCNYTALWEVVYFTVWHGNIECRLKISIEDEEGGTQSGLINQNYSPLTIKATTEGEGQHSLCLILRQTVSQSQTVQHHVSSLSMALHVCMCVCLRDSERWQNAVLSKVTTRTVALPPARVRVSPWQCVVTYQACLSCFRYRQVCVCVWSHLECISSVISRFCSTTFDGYPEGSQMLSPRQSPSCLRHGRDVHHCHAEWCAYSQVWPTSQ